jgi:D-sedoheptulose 7-phosphate isomerase
MDLAAIEKAIGESVATIASLRDQAPGIAAIGARFVQALKQGNKVLTAGNGGSAAEALHMSEELVGRYRNNRVSLPAVSLTADGTALTCIGNDYGYDYVFSRQVEGLGKPGDILVLFSTSGRARNLERALEAGRERGMVIVSLLGRDGGVLAGRADHEVIVVGQATERIQEAHQVILHLILDAVEHAFVDAPGA